MQKITLTPSEVQILTMVGSLRNTNTSAKCAEQIQSDLDPVQISVDGVLSEYMVAKHKGWFFDVNCEVRAFGADLVSPQGHTIDVKSSRTKNGPMNIRYSHKDKPHDFYIFVEMESDSVGYIVGAVSKRVALQESNVVKNSKGDPYFRVSRDQITPIGN